MKRILIVEDNAFFLQFLKETLHARFPSTDILEAANGEEALQKIKTLPPEAIFMDLRLPGANGLEMIYPSIGRLRTNPGQIIFFQRIPF
jgi:CheY-like chemotaxis protein